MSGWIKSGCPINGGFYEALFPILMIFCLLFSVIVPVCATSSFFIDDSLIYHFGLCIPEGTYKIVVPASGLETSEFTVKYDVVDPAQTWGQEILYSTAEVMYGERSVSFDVIYDVDNDCTIIGKLILLEGSGWDSQSFHLGTSYEFVSVASRPSLFGVVDSTALPGVLEPVVSLLPIILAVMVGYMAIRKGISFLLDFICKI